jgi:hypothetical protein
VVLLLEFHAARFRFKEQQVSAKYLELISDVSARHGSGQIKEALGQPVVTS